MTCSHILNQFLKNHINQNHKQKANSGNTTAQKDMYFFFFFLRQGTCFVTQPVLRSCFFFNLPVWITGVHYATQQNIFHMLLVRILEANWTLSNKISGFCALWSINSTFIKAFQKLVNISIIIFSHYYVRMSRVAVCVTKMRTKHLKQKGQRLFWEVHTRVP